MCRISVKGNSRARSAADGGLDCRYALAMSGSALRRGCRYVVITASKQARNHGRPSLAGTSRWTPCGGYVRDAELFKDHAGTGLLQLGAVRACNRAWTGSLPAKFNSSNPSFAAAKGTGHFAQTDLVRGRLLRAGPVPAHLAPAGSLLGDFARAGSLPADFAQAGLVGAFASTGPVVGHLAQPVLGHLDRVLPPGRPRLGFL